MSQRMSGGDHSTKDHSTTSLWAWGFPFATPLSSGLPFVTFPPSPWQHGPAAHSDTNYHSTPQQEVLESQNGLGQKGPLKIILFQNASLLQDAKGSCHSLDKVQIRDLELTHRVACLSPSLLSLILLLIATARDFLFQLISPFEINPLTRTECLILDYSRLWKYFATMKKYLLSPQLL